MSLKRVTLVFENNERKFNDFIASLNWRTSCTSPAQVHMGNRFKNAEHLIRVAVVFIAALILFVMVRGMIVPKSFGQLGHYRADALQDIAARTPAFAGREACANCHQEIVDLKMTGKHAGVGCEACHGPLAKHVGCAGPAGVAAAKEEVARFHEQMNKGEVVKLYQETDNEFKIGASLPFILKTCAHIRESLGQAKASKITFVSTEFGFGGQKVSLGCRAKDRRMNSLFSESGVARPSLLGIGLQFVDKDLQ